MKIAVQGIPSHEARLLQAGGRDANGQAPLRHVSRGWANPCRHCLRLIADGEDKLILSYRPFATAHPYAETGPIFLHPHGCERYQADQLPDWFSHLDPAIVRGYGRDDWIRYETGAVVSGKDLTASCHAILADPQVAYVHIRSKFNCFQCRVERG